LKISKIIKKIIMKLNFTNFLLKIKSAAIIFCVLFFVAGFSTFAHTVTGYTTNCGTGPSYSVDATVTNVNAASNYAWQYKNTSNVWVCLLNGNNTISGNVYNISGATSTATLDPAPIIFTNPNSGLNGLVIRCVISDGAGVNPCNVPVNNTWNSDAASLNLTISVSGSACGATTNCSCPGNLVINPSFENGTYGWGSSGGNFNAGTGAVVCGSYSGDFQITNTASNWVSQTIGTNLVAGTVIRASVYSGVHDNSFNAWLSIAFFDAAWTYLGTNSVSVQVDKVLATAPVGPQLYNLTATVPAGAVYSQIGYGATGNWIKTDNWCVTTTPPVTSGSIGDYVWNDGNGNGIQDATEVGLNGVTIQLKNSAGTVIATTTSDATGYYQFTGLAAGTYTVTFLSVAGYGTSPANQGTDDTKDSDVTNDASGNAVATVVLSSGQSNQTIDAGFCPITLQLGNRVWNDVNNNGINDGEAGIANVTVHLYKDNNNDNVADGAFIATLITDASGFFSFDNLVPGNYIIGVVTPAGFVKSSINGGDPDNDINLDNNGIIIVGNETRGNAITLVGGTEPDGVNTNTNNNITYDFGFYGSATASLGDYVWNDANGNGIQDATEVGLSGVTVQLKNTAGTIIATTTSNASGFYQFTGIAPGTYTVQFVAVAGFGVSPANVGTNDAIDSDVDGSGSVTVTLAAGESNQTIDAGFCPTTLSIGNTVWYDQNNDGIKQTSEIGIAGATVNIYQDANNDNIADGGAFATTTTSATGVYSFSNLIPGNYIIGVIKPAGYTNSAVNAGDPDNNIDNDNNGINTIGSEVRGNSISVTGGTEPDGSGATNTNSNNTYDFGLTGTGSIGDFVFNDTNGNGIQDAGEVGIAGVIVTLTYPNGTTVTTTTTATGSYTFSNLAPGTTYSIAFSTPAGYLASPSNVGANDNVDSDPVAGVATGVVVTAGVANTSVDAGFYQSNLNLGNSVWYDQNNDGIKQATEFGIAGATVRLYADANNDNVADGAAIATTTTAADGTYSFAGLAPGSYIVGVTTPAGYTAVTTNGGDPDNDIDNDNNGTNTSVAGEVRTSAITLATGTEPTTDGDGSNGNLSADIALKGTGSIGDFVFNDTNGNGLQDAGETGLAGVTVTLTYPNGSTVTTVTDAAGKYNFPNLAPGTTYSVAFSTPAGYSPATANIGANDAIDSDPINGIVTGVVVTAGVANTSVDAGFNQKVNLGNIVFYDQNNDGIKQSTETGVAGATVNLYADANNDNIADGVAIATTTTATNGTYLFTNLNPGNYIVGVIIPSGYAVVTTNGGDPDNNIDNDNNGTNTTQAGEVRTPAITLTSGAEPTTDGDDSNGNLTVDIALRGTGSIGDLVFNDLNGNGNQDFNEGVIGGVTVTLTYPNGTTVSTVTDAFGIYNFPNLAPGTTYSVTFTTPAGYVASPANVGANDTTDSDPINGVATGIVVISGVANTSVDAGFYLCSVASGINGPATICAAEPALFTATAAGVGSVYSWTFDQATPATASGSSVSAAWSTPGEYLITLVVTKNGCTSTYTKTIVITQSVFANAGPDKDICSGSSATLTGTGPTGATYSWVVLSGDPTSIDNGVNQSSVLVSPLVTTTYQLTVSQNGCTRVDQVTVFINVNKNPVADAGTNKVTLIGTPVIIGGSPTGTPPLATPGAALGYIWSATTGLNDATLANPTATLTVPGVYNYQVIVYSILTGCSDTATVSVTAIQPVNVGNTVYYDKNNNGLKDASDNGIVGATVKLYADANNDNVADGAALATTTTSTTGTYNFGNLYPGNYIVGVNIPSGYAVVTTNGGDPDNNIDNDNNGTNTSVAGEVKSSAVTLTAGGEPAVGIDGDDANGNATVDFGFKGTAIIGDFVWNDANRNGIQDAGELGIPNATVTLTYATGGTVSTTTNSLGAYQFTNLAPGTGYSLTFATPNGYTPTLSNVTGGTATDLNDSDPIGGVISGVTLTAAQINNTLDAGFYTPINIAGNVWHDVNGLLNNEINNTPGAASIPSGLNVYLINDATGKIEQSEIVANNGTYTFFDVKINTSYRIVVSTIFSFPGDNEPKAVLPTGWFKVGENLGAGPNSGSDGVIDGILFIDTETQNISNANFGIKLKNGDVVIG
jgi:hypothetical protein